VEARTTFKDAVRDMGGVTVQIERRTLQWLAPRLPRVINSDHLTVLAAAAMMMAGLAYWVSAFDIYALWLVNICLAINWFGDSLDGTVARIRNHQRPRYGFYVDHVVDAAGLTMLVGGMALSGYMTPLVAFGVLAAYLLLCVEVYLATYCLSTFRMSFFKVGPTELRILLALGNAATFFFHPDPHVTVFGVPARLFDVAGVLATAGLVLAFVLSVIRNTRTLYRAEPIPRT
jgi:archaetidylinositol phosphate synthase